MATCWGPLPPHFRGMEEVNPLDPGGGAMRARLMRSPSLWKYWMALERVEVRLLLHTR